MGADPELPGFALLIAELIGIALISTRRLDPHHSLWCQNDRPRGGRCQGCDYRDPRDARLQYCGSVYGLFLSLASPGHCGNADLEDHSGHVEEATMAFHPEAFCPEALGAGMQSSRWLRRG
jgi:hypothetical protein